MGGCDNCEAKPGCEDRKGTMFTALEETMERLYPTRRWGEPDDLARFGAGVPEGDVDALADDLATELDASTLVRRGGPEEYCDYIYILCIGREPSAIQIRDGGVPVPDEIGDEPIREQYLRVCVSGMARMAGVQQTAVNLDLLGDELVIRESPRAGVYDAPLLPRLQRLVALLPAYDIVHLDFGEISMPAEGFDPGPYREMYGCDPHVANYLFYPQPSTTVTTTVLRRSESAPALAG